MIYSFENLPQQVANLSEQVQLLSSKIEDLSKSTTPVNNTISIDEVSQLTGYSKKYIYQLVHRNAIPFHKPAHGGRKLIFLRSEILDWMKAKHSESSQDYCNRMELELSYSKDGRN